MRGARAIVTGHHITESPVRDGPWWQIDTGAGSPGGKLSIVQIECDPIIATTVDVVASEQVRPAPSSAAKTLS